MTRVKEIQDKEKAPKLNVDASKRFVRNALWAAAHKQSPAQQQATKRKYLIVVISACRIVAFAVKMLRPT
jgi:hypothetical protein